jgi:hypothetical protein
MNNKQKGFAFVETTLLLVVVCLVIGAGYYVWYRHNHSGSVAPSPKPVSNCGNVKDPSTDCTTHLNGWTTYKSSHSSITFSYPSSWKAVSNKLTPNYGLESITMYGPNNFQLDFNLDTSHVNAAASCALVHYGTVVPLYNGLVIVPTIDSSSNGNVNTINLMSATYKDVSSHSGCGLSFYPNLVGKTMGYIFSGSYQMQDNSLGGTYTPKPESGYFNLPEVQTAKTVFESFKQ